MQSVERGETEAGPGGAFSRKKNYLGVLLENKADYGGAEQHYRRARAIDPEEHADAHCELAGQPRPSWCL